jgi:hypothetical protein
MCATANRRQAWRRIQEDRIGRKTVEAAAKERVAGVAVVGGKGKGTGRP